MKRIFTILFLLSVFTNLYAQTPVNGNQSGTWTAANSPYQVTGDITVSAGQTLTIEAGVEVNFQGFYKITVLGTLEATGTETDSIFFTTDNQATGWHGISLGKSVEGNVTSADGVCRFLYCKFQYGKTATDDEYPDMNGGAVRMLDSDATYNNCVFLNNTSLPSEGMGGAIYAINTSSGGGSDNTTFTDCKFIGNIGYSEGGAIKFTSDLGSVITRCEFINNTTSNGGGAIMFYSVIDTKMINCLFANNSSNYSNGGALETLGNGNSIFLKNCTMVGNEAVNGSGGALALYYGSADFVNCIVYNNTSQYDDDNVYIDAGGGTGTVNYCDIAMPEYNTTGANNIETDPLFVDANSGDYHLTENSPCIDAGTDIGLEYVGIAPDMGCYEYGASSNIAKTEPGNLLINPNPASSFIKIETGNYNIETVEISDLSGKKIMDVTEQNMLDISNLPNGVYIIKIKTDKKNYTRKLIKS